MLHGYFLDVARGSDGMASNGEAAFASFATLCSTVPSASVAVLIEPLGLPSFAGAMTTFLTLPPARSIGKAAVDAQR